MLAPPPETRTGSTDLDDDTFDKAMKQMLLHARVAEVSAMLGRPEFCQDIAEPDDLALVFTEEEEDLINRLHQRCARLASRRESRNSCLPADLGSIRQGEAKVSEEEDDATRTTRPEAATEARAARCAPVRDEVSHKPWPHVMANRRRSSAAL